MLNVVSLCVSNVSAPNELPPKFFFLKNLRHPPPLPLCWNYFLIGSGKKIQECPEIFRGSLACLTFYIFKTVPTPTLVVCKGRDEVARVHAPSAGGHVRGPEGVGQTGWPLMAPCSGQYGKGWPLSVRHTLSGFQPFLMPRNICRPLSLKLKHCITMDAPTTTWCFLPFSAQVWFE